MNKRLLDKNNQNLVHHRHLHFTMNSFQTYSRFDNSCVRRQRPARDDSSESRRHFAFYSKLTSWILLNFLLAFRIHMIKGLHSVCKQQIAMHKFLYLSHAHTNIEECMNINQHNTLHDLQSTHSKSTSSSKILKVKQQWNSSIHRSVTTL